MRRRTHKQKTLVGGTRKDGFSGWRRGVFMGWAYGGAGLYFVFLDGGREMGNEFPEEQSGNELPHSKARGMRALFDVNVFAKGEWFSGWRNATTHPQAKNACRWHPDRWVFGVAKGKLLTTETRRDEGEAYWGVVGSGEKRVQASLGCALPVPVFRATPGGQ